MNGGPSGFNNAPVTRAIVIASALFTVFFGIRGRSSKLGWSYQQVLSLIELIVVVLGIGFNYTNFSWFWRITSIYFDSFQDVFTKLQIWKLIVSVFAFSSTPELVFGIYLLYFFRVFERQIGSNKYSVFIFFSVVVSLLLEVVALKLLKDPSLKILTSGPYGLIFSSFVPFYLDIPVSAQFRVLGFQFSNKTFIYIAGLQLLLSSWKRSLLPGICGLLTGFLYRVNVFHIRRLKFPEFVASFFSRLSWPSTGSASPTGQGRNIVGNAPSYAGRQVEGLSSTINPPEDSISTLVSMGFERNSARQALIRARNDINAATNILLESQSH